eukprot:4803301-Lingulodinium_polyedra.AAC.1
MDIVDSAKCACVCSRLCMISPELPLVVASVRLLLSARPPVPFHCAALVAPAANLLSHPVPSFCGFHWGLPAR